MEAKQQRLDEIVFHLRWRHHLVRHGNGMSVSGRGVVYGPAVGTDGLTKIHEAIHRDSYRDGTVDHDLRDLKLASSRLA
jgi:hypothetical protein